MKNIKLLDCTLRDGGFINNWNFGEDGIVNIIERLDEANVDIIEIGYLREYVDYEINETQFPHTKYIGNIMPKQFSMRPMVVAIIDYGNFGLDKILPCKEVPIDGIRITFKKNQIDEALDFCKKIEKLGYKIFAQPVSFMDYSQREILDLIDKINELQPFAVSIVDTYGFMNQKDLIHRVNLIDDTLNEDIYLGYHSRTQLRC